MNWFHSVCKAGNEQDLDHLVISDDKEATKTTRVRPTGLWSQCEEAPTGQRQTILS